jgi:hypothetical protein
LSGVLLQFGEILEGVGLAKFAGVDQTHEQVSRAGSILGLVEIGVFAMQDRFLQGMFTNIVVERCSGVPEEEAQRLPVPEHVGDRLAQTTVVATPHHRWARPCAACGTERGEVMLAVWCSSVGSPEKRFCRPAGDPSDKPPIKRKPPATTDDTSRNQSFHAPLPKEHVVFCVPAAINCQSTVESARLGMKFNWKFQLT